MLTKHYSLLKSAYLTEPGTDVKSAYLTEPGTDVKSTYLTEPGPTSIRRTLTSTKPGTGVKSAYLPRDNASITLWDPEVIDVHLAVSAAWEFTNVG